MNNSVYKKASVAMFKSFGLNYTRRYGARTIFRSTQKRAFSFEPTVVVNSLTEGLHLAHIYTGVPWWALIPITTFTLRSVWTLPLAFLQRLRIQKQNELRPIISATNPVLKLNLAKKVQAAKQKAEEGLKTAARSKEPKVEDIAPMHSPLANMKFEEILVLSTKETRKRQKALFKKHNVQLWKNFILPTFQIPLWVCMSLTMRNLSGWSTWDSLANKPLDPTLYNEGILWFTDLTSLDSFHAFPLILGIVSLCNVEWTFKTFELLRPSSNKRSTRPTITDSISNLSRMSVVFLMAISLNAPMALVIYWVSSQMFSLVQNVILDYMVPISYTPNKRFSYKKLKSEDAESVVKISNE